MGETDDMNWTQGWDWDIDSTAVPLCEIGVLQYLDGDTGETQYGIRHKGGVPVSTFLGLLELAKTDILSKFRAENL